MRAMDKYDKIKKIGEGSFGKALLVRKKDDGKFYVVKEVNTTKMNRKEREEAKKEVRVLSQMHHPNIVTYRESFEESGVMYIVMDYCDGGDLYSRINKQRAQPFPEDQILDWFVQLCLAVKHVHDRKILHRDIKSQNIFLTKSGRVKLGDFGIARVLSSTVELARTCIGTPYYLSPEICENRPYNNKSDIWAMGCVLYEVTTLKHAFEAGNMKNLVLKIIRGSYPPVSSSYSYDLRHLITQCFKRNPRDRPSVNAILRLGFIQRRIESFLSQSMISDEFAHTILHRHGQPVARRAVAPAVKKVEARPAAAAAAAPVKRRDPAAIYGAPIRPQQRLVKPAIAAAKRPAGDGAKAAALRLKQKREQEKKEQISAMQRKRKEAEERDKKQKDVLKAEKERYESNVKARQQQLADRQQLRMRNEAAKSWQQTLALSESRPLPPNPLAANNKENPPDKNGEKKEPSHSAAKQSDVKEAVGDNVKRIHQVGQAGQAKEAEEGFWLPQPSPSPAEAAAYQARADRAKASDVAERARIVEEFLSRRKEAAANRARAEIELGWKADVRRLMEIGQGPRLQEADVQHQHRDQLSKPAGRNAPEREYLARLEAIRRQNFQERRGIMQRNNRPPVHPTEVRSDDCSPLKAQDDPRFDPEARKRKIAALKAQADLKAAQFKEQLEKKRAGEEKRQELPNDKENEMEQQGQTVGLDAALKEVGVTKVVKPSQQAQVPVVSDVPADARKKWGKKLKQEEVGLPLSNISLEATASQMEATSAADKVVVSAPVASKLKVIDDEQREADRKKWVEPVAMVAAALSNLELRGTHTIDPSQTVKPTSEVEEKVDKPTGGERPPTSAVEAETVPVTLTTSGVSVTVDQVLNAKDGPTRPGRSELVPNIGTDSDATDGQSDGKETVEQGVSTEGCEKPVVETDLLVEEIEYETVENQFDGDSASLDPWAHGGQHLDAESASETTSICSHMAVAGSSPRSSPALTFSSGEEEADSGQQGYEKKQLDKMVEQTEQGIGTGEEAGDESDYEKNPLNASFSDGLKSGCYDVSKQVLRTCSMPDLGKLFQTELQDDKDFVIGFPFYQNGSLNSNQQDKMVMSDGSPVPRAAEADLKAEIPREEAQLKEENLDRFSDDDDEELREMLATMKTVLEDSYVEEEEDVEGEDEEKEGNEDSDDDKESSPPLNESWQNSDGEFDDDNKEEASDDESDQTEGSLFCRLEETRQQLEKQLGFDRFMKAYKFIQALQEDEDETLNVSNQHATQVGQMLGDENDNLFPAILKLVMADAVYCETYEPESDPDS